MIEERIKNINYLTTANENHYLDRKSARKRPNDLLKYIVGFANAAGGYLVIGIEDNGDITGFKVKNAYSKEEFKNVALTGLTKTPVLVDSFELPVTNINNEDDIVLILSINPSYDRVIESFDNNVYLRFGDKTQILNNEQINQLKYDKGERYFEDEISADSTIDDIDLDLLQQYKEIMATPNLSTLDILNARNFIRNGNLTNACILLFGKNPTKFLPQARLKFIRYDSSTAKVGTEINIIKERTFDGPIPKIISKAKEFINTQFREFQYLDANGIFKKMPEYPEFAWFEGIVNALTHRNYSIRGEYIKVIMYDDRLEIHSPGILPNIVTIENILTQRYSRNPRIARVLSEFGWVKEMNEGVKRIYSEMEKFFLKSPTYSEPNKNSVLLLLENNILSRNLRSLDSIKETIGIESFGKLDSSQKALLRYAFNAGSIDSQTAAVILNKSSVYARNQLKKLSNLGLLEWHGSSKNDPTQNYTFKKFK